MIGDLDLSGSTAQWVTATINAGGWLGLFALVVRGWIANRSLTIQAREVEVNAEQVAHAEQEAIRAHLSKELSRQNDQYRANMAEMEQRYRRLLEESEDHCNQRLAHRDARIDKLEADLVQERRDREQDRMGHINQMLQLNESVKRVVPQAAAMLVPPNGNANP